MRQDREPGSESSCELQGLVLTELAEYPSQVPAQQNAVICFAFMKHTNRKSMMVLSNNTSSNNNNHHHHHHHHNNHKS